MLPVCVWGSPRYLGTHVTALPSQFVYCPLPTYTAAIPNTTAGLRFRLAAEQVHTKSLRSDTVCVCGEWQSGKVIVLADTKQVNDEVMTSETAE